jgi:hypothetical protein
MKELIVITSHCKDDDQIKELEKCVDSVINFGHHIAIISHTHLPLHIQKKCQYYFYDYFNDISEDPDLLGYISYRFNNGDVINSKFFNKYFYGFAIYRMISISAQIARIFKYDNIHYLEYDCQILDKGLLDKHSELLKTYDSVFYTDNGKENELLFGSFKSVKVDKLPTVYLDYDRDSIEENIKKLTETYLENFTRDILLKEGNYCILPLSEITQDNFDKGKKFHSRNIHYTLYFDPIKNLLCLFYMGLNEDEEIYVTINNTIVFPFKVKSNNWRVQELGNFDSVKHVKIDNGNKIIYKKEFTDEYKEIFKVKSYIVRE